MNFSQMCEIEPELQRLESSAHFAGEHGADWIATLFAVHETLTKVTGSGAMHEELQLPACYEVARAAIFRAWSRGAKSQPIPPPKPPPFESGDDAQQTFLDVSEPYR